ncbi:alpha/beta hydrolase [Streptomyces sp. NPDC050549]|uniref:alpha/beta hydrolase n=1 Tax=Streptomyces sp. NPDC050549 TaxID=3155406 RepID=UPI00344880B0
MTSTLTWQQLRDLSLSELDDAADGWAKVSHHADASAERVDAEMSGSLAKTQESEAAKAAIRRLNRLSSNYHYIHAECGLIRSSVDGLSTELAAPQRRLKDALDDAATLSFTVNQDGSIGYPAGGENTMTGEKIPGGTVVGNDGTLTSGNKGLFPPNENGLYTPGTGPGGTPGLINPNPNHAKAQDIGDRIAHALREAREIDERYQTALSKLKAGPGLTVDAKTWADAAADVKAVGAAQADYLKDNIPLDKSPAARKDWWVHLTQEQREEYLAVYPDVVGNLDGIPAMVRDEANRENIQLLMGKLSGQHDEKSKTILDGLKSIDSQLRNPVPGSPPMYLLGIGDQGNGRAIVSYGNPDAAKNVSAYVPGLGTALDADFARNDLKRAQDTAIDAQKYDPSSASIVWLGYDAPQIPASEVIHNADVMSMHDAKVGAASYDNFMAGISATNEHADPHITAIGHSYGSLTVGQAAQREGGIPGVDDIILVGSPGTGADNAADLNVGKNHVFVGAAENDPVTMLPNHREAGGLGVGSGVGAIAGTVLGHQSGGGFLGDIVGGAWGAAVGGVAGYDIGDSTSDPDEIWFGTDPASKEFGARRFAVDDGPMPSLHDPAPAHSNYFNPEKDLQSATNIAKIVAGESDRIKMEQWR